MTEGNGFLGEWENFLFKELVYKILHFIAAYGWTGERLKSFQISQQS